MGPCPRLQLLLLKSDWSAADECAHGSVGSTCFVGRRVHNRCSLVRDKSACLMQKASLRPQT